MQPRQLKTETRLRNDYEYGVDAAKIIWEQENNLRLITVYSDTFTRLEAPYLTIGMWQSRLSRPFRQFGSRQQIAVLAACRFGFISC